MSTTIYGPNFIGNIIRIIDKRTIIVNVGNDVLSPEDKIQVYELGPEITNRDGSVLCKYEFVKDELEVIWVTPCYAVCRKNKTVTRNSISLALSPLLTGQYTEHEPLNVLEEEIQPLKISDPIIHVGDPVKRA